MSSETPSWLASGNENPAPAPAPAGGLETSTASGGAATADYGDSSAADDKELPGVILTMRLANMGVAGALIAVSVRCIDHLWVLGILAFHLLYFTLINLVFSMLCRLCSWLVFHQFPPLCWRSTPPVVAC